jgi:hypothetical protein
MKNRSWFYSSIIAALLFSISAGAQISTKDMLSRIDNDKITLQRAPLVNVPAQIRDKELEMLHAQFPKFKDSMWYMAYVKENGYSNIIRYDWSSDECVYLVYNDDALKKKTKEVAQFIQSKGQMGSSSARREVIPLKYCEKIYNFYSTKKE